MSECNYKTDQGVRTVCMSQGLPWNAVAATGSSVQRVACPRSPYMQERKLSNQEGGAGQQNPRVRSRSSRTKPYSRLVPRNRQLSPATPVDDGNGHALSSPTVLSQPEKPATPSGRPTLVGCLDNRQTQAPPTRHLLRWATLLKPAKGGRPCTAASRRKNKTHTHDTAPPPEKAAGQARPRRK